MTWLGSSMAESNAFTLFESTARLSPDRTALVDATTGSRHTYGDLYSRSASVAASLEARGIGNGDHLFLLAYNSPEFLEIMLAAFRLGATAVPVNFRLSPRTVEYCLSNSEPACVFFDSDLETKLPPLDGRPVYRIETGDSSPARAVNASPYESLFEDENRSVAVPRDVDTPAVMFYTSGTSGQPKGVPQSHENLIYCSHSHISALELCRDDVTVTSCPLSTAAGLNTLVLPILNQGGGVVLTYSFDPKTAGELLARHGVTTMFAVPSVLNGILENSKLEQCELRYVIGGGEPVPAELKAAYAERGIPLHTIYGLTETTDGTHIEPPWKPSGEDPKCIGKPLPFVETKVVDNRGNLVPPGEPGELVMRGPLVTERYWRRPNVTNDVWDDGWFHTGDIVVEDNSGLTRVLGRVDDMLLQDGENIYPAEIEHVIQSHPDVETAVVLEGPSHDNSLVAAVVSTSDSLTKKLLTEFTADRLASFKHPSRVEFVSSIPHTAMGKTDRAALKHELFDQ